MPKKTTSNEVKKFTTGGGGRPQLKAQVKLPLTPLELAEQQINKLLMDARAWDGKLTHVRGTLNLY